MRFSAGFHRPVGIVRSLGKRGLVRGERPHPLAPSPSAAGEGEPWLARSFHAGSDQPDSGLVERSHNPNRAGVSSRTATVDTRRRRIRSDAPPGICSAVG